LVRDAPIRYVMGKDAEFHEAAELNHLKALVLHWVAVA
jgi:hypothetical protein